MVQCWVEYTSRCFLSSIMKRYSKRFVRRRSILGILSRKNWYYTFWFVIYITTFKFFKVKRVSTFFNFSDIYNMNMEEKSICFMYFIALRSIIFSFPTTFNGVPTTPLVIICRTILLFINDKTIITTFPQLFFNREINSFEHHSPWNIVNNIS